MTDVELRHLATFAAVVTEGSFGLAASRLGYTQSTVSQHLANLERAIGGRVFDRPGGPRRVELTPLGRVVHAHAAELLASAEAIHTAVERFNAGESRLTIGTFQSVSNTFLPSVVRSLLDEFPTCEIQLIDDESDSPDLSTVDLQFYDLRTNEPDVEQIKLFDDPYLLVSPRGQFPEGSVGLAELAGTSMVAWPPDCAQPALEESLSTRGIHPHFAFRASGNEAILSMVRAGLGCTILPWLAIHGAGAMADDALSVHTLTPPVAEREIYLRRPANRTVSPLGARAVEVITENARNLIVRR